MSERRKWYGARFRDGGVAQWTIRESKGAVRTAMRATLREDDGSNCTDEAIKAAGWRIVPVRVEWDDE